MQQEYLNVGCGSNIQSGFINLDYCWQRGVDLCWDITKKIPLPDNSIKGIFCEHCLEHIPFDQCLNVLKNFRRVLKKEGRIRIVVPDAELYLDLYNKKKSGESVLFPFQTIDDNKTSMMHVNQCFRDHGHQFAYDAETLSKLLEKAGFVDIERRSFMVGKDNTLLIDTESRSKESLYLEAGI
jgi:predicted SAM-dependent methyltransferase